MTVPAPRRAHPGFRPPGGGPAAHRYVPRAGVTLAGLCLVAATAAAAPPAPDTPTGCGDLANGRLCLRGPVGATGRYTTAYRRQGPGPGPAATSSDTSVRLGYQRKNTRITAFPGWFGTRRLRQGAAALGGRVEMLPDECIRGVMEHDGTVFVTKWSCG
ncbi:hypothetical protein [Streptomyces gilvosporeus]|uniref:Uncharacterized protein n=1 Tax=Streptomyces gilvosporeus TaxID=553510 RepID=A0A1V0TRN4_9ACTN|nr:hypothetical protein [Streptomyces gilvosporeus]ARF55615.1 hypothetical protein B1H19_16800 [Streptomyces gilvosporeus]